MNLALRILRSLLLGLGGLAVALGLGAAVVWYFATDSTPRISGAASLTPTHIERAKRLLERNDPRTLRPGVLRTITVSEEDLDLAVNYLANRFGQGSSKIELSQGKAHVRASVLLPPMALLPAGRYLNIDAWLGETTVLPQFDHLTIGQLRVPAFVANRFFQALIARLQRSASYGAATDTIKNVSSRNGLLSVVYEWNDAVPAQLAAALVPVEDQLRMQAYQARLAELTAPGGQPAFQPTRLRTHRPYSLSLAALVQALFQLAEQRGGDAAAEHRAAIIVMAFYVNGKGLGAIIPAARQWPVPAVLGVTLAGRDDFSQHFTVSAALAATAGSPLSDAIGLYKELEDSRGGAGFSFNDIAADRAGTRFGELATGPDGGTRKLQALLKAGVRDEDLVPHTADLPEFLRAAEFRRRYGGVGAPAYAKIMKDIEQRIAALPLYSH